MGPFGRFLDGFQPKMWFFGYFTVTYFRWAAERVAGVSISAVFRAESGRGTPHRFEGQGQHLPRIAGEDRRLSGAGGRRARTAGEGWVGDGGGLVMVAGAAQPSRGYLALRHDNRFF